MRRILAALPLVLASLVLGATVVAAAPPAESVRMRIADTAIAGDVVPFQVFVKHPVRVKKTTDLAASALITYPDTSSETRQLRRAGATVLQGRFTMPESAVPGDIVTVVVSGTFRGVPFTFTETVTVVEAPVL